jgi:hypothetical protein
MGARGNTIITLSTTIKPGEKLPETVELTTDDPANNVDSFAGKDEQDLVNELFGKVVESVSPTKPIQRVNPQHGHCITDALGLSNNAWCVTNSDNPYSERRCKAPGDIDVILCEPDGYQRAIAMEVKAVLKRGAEHNKLAKLEKGCRQAEGLLCMGFHQVYIGVVIELYGRHDKSSQNTLTRQGQQGSESIEIVKDKLREFSLSKSIGILIVEAVQLGGLDRRAFGRVTVSNIRPAEAHLHQSARATEIARGLLSQ